LITTYEIILAEVSFLSKFKWRFVVVDEAHRLKNPESKLYKAMMEELEMPVKLLLTGMRQDEGEGRGRKEKEEDGGTGRFFWV
jgi:hypothetical protein